MTRSILSMTDFSLGARHAAERAAMLGATGLFQEGVLLHVLEKSWLDSLKQFLDSEDSFGEEIINDASRSLARLAKEVQNVTGFFLEPQVRSGDILNTLVAAAPGFDLLVLGARGRHPVRALALGTTSQRFLSKVQQPILVVKSKARNPYQRVLVATDFSPNSLKGLQYTPIIAPKALVNVVHVFEPLFESKMISAGASDKVIEEYRIDAQIKAESEMTRFIDQADVERHNIARLIEYGHIRVKLPEIVARLVPDLIVVGKHGRSRIEEFLLGSVTLHALAESPCDVFVVE